MRDKRATRLARICPVFLDIVISIYEQVGGVVAWIAEKLFRDSTTYIPPLSARYLSNMAGFIQNNVNAAGGEIFCYRVAVMENA